MGSGIAKWIDSLRPRPLDAREWAAMRWLFILVLAYHFLDHQPFSFKTNPHPTGITALVPLTFLGEPNMYVVQWCVVIPAMLLYALGIWPGVMVGVLALVSTLVRTHVNAQGFNQHATQIVSVVLWAQCIVYAIHAWRKRRGLPDEGMWSVGLPGVLLYYSQGAIGASYMLAGVAKLLNSKGMWAWNAPYLSTDIVKSTRQAYYSTLDQAYAGVVESAQWLVEHPWLARAGFTWALVLELAALVALRNRTWALITGLSLIALHLGIQWMMHLNFVFNEALLLIFLVNPVGWLMLWWNRPKAQPGGRERPLAGV